MIETRYRGTRIAAPTREAVRQIIPDYEVMLVAALDVMLRRFERNPNYRFIDTKLSLLTGEEFPEAADPARDYRGKSAVYGWIQGRGLEALAGHIRWLPSCGVLSNPEKEERIGRLTAMLAALLDNLERLRAHNHRRVPFLMTPEGEPFTLDDQGRRAPLTLDPAQTTAADLFYSKGLLAAAALLGQTEKVAEAKAYFREVCANIVAGRHQLGQVSFDPKNQVAPVPGKHGHGMHMIALGGYALAASLDGAEEWFTGGQAFIRHIIDRHIQQGQLPVLQPYDFVEAVDAQGNPWEDERGILCDPGHSLEFVGLAAKFLLVLKAKPNKTPEQEALLRECAALFPKVLAKNFENGLNRRVGGLCKAFDLRARRPINSDMPWWNLPETLRAAAELLHLSPPETHAACLSVLQQASNAFVTHFVNRDVHLMAYQTVDEHGTPVEVIPATPDADPGYHTGLSLIDFLVCLHPNNGL